MTFTAPPTQPRVPAAVDHEVRQHTFTDAVSTAPSAEPLNRTRTRHLSIVNRNSGKPLAIAGNSTADVPSGPASGTPPGRSAPPDAYNLRYTTSGKMLDVNAGSSTTATTAAVEGHGSPTRCGTCTTGDGYYTIVAEQRTGSDVYAAATNDGHSRAMTPTAHQPAWQFVPA